MCSEDNDEFNKGFLERAGFKNIRIIPDSAIPKIQAFFEQFSNGITNYEGQQVTRNDRIADLRSNCTTPLKQPTTFQKMCSFAMTFLS